MLIQGYAQEAHFAVFPSKLIEPCIKAGCPADGTVLDPFSGAGTTALVCQRLGREFIGIEPSAAYIEMTYRRLRKEQP
jgi:site-specific DNA-methyltransferase (adenine-specific)